MGCTSLFRSRFAKAALDKSGGAAALPLKIP